MHPSSIGVNTTSDGIEFQVHGTYLHLHHWVQHASFGEIPSTYASASSLPYTHLPITHIADIQTQMIPERVSYARWHFDHLKGLLKWTISVLPVHTQQTAHGVVVTALGP